MKKSFGAALLIAALFSMPVLAGAQPAVAGTQEYEPSVGQAGKDVIWVPTPDDLIDAMLTMGGVTADDFVIDLGSGDGRIVIAAAKLGARATGIEYNPDMVELSRRSAEKAGVADKATFMQADLFTVDLGILNKATVITMYLLPSLNMKLRPTILDLKPGTRVVSHAFNMGEWEYDQIVEKEGRTAYLWIVPAKVEGKWTAQSKPVSSELNLTQTFQKIEGTMRAGGTDQPISNAKIEGSHISFVCGDQEYTGQVNGKTIDGTIRVNGREEQWTATRN